MTPGTEVIGPIQDKGADTVPLPLPEQVREYIRASKAESTVRGYHADWKHFCGWCDMHELCPLPASAEAVASYIAECADYLKVGSIQRRLNAIAEAHKTVRRRITHAQSNGKEHGKGHSANDWDYYNAENRNTDGRYTGDAGSHRRRHDRH